MAYSLPTDDRLSAIAFALGLSAEELRNGRFDGIVSGHNELRASQTHALVKAFNRIENAKTRAHIVGLVEAIVIAERPPE